MAANHTAHLRRPTLACSQDPLYQILPTFHCIPRGFPPFYQITHPRHHRVELDQGIPELGLYL